VGQHGLVTKVLEAVYLPSRVEDIGIIRVSVKFRICWLE
jgi:hypothetical protein